MAGALIDAWQRAADDLGIRVHSQGRAVRVLDFGSPHGMLCAIPSEGLSDQELRRDAEAAGCGWSVLSTFYCEYDREAYVDMLNDWQWTGEGEPPQWYTGEPTE
ncbi:MAG: hypothetical protein M3N47_05135 [Chloroflexota bacterium]|nr:hypothetical protein [Chloroflexota bacterium]